MLPNGKTQAAHPDAAAVQEPRQRGRLRRGARRATSSARPRRPAPTSSPRPRRRSCSSRTARVVGVRSGDKGRGKDGEPLGNFEPGTDIAAQATVLAEGCWGHLTGAAIREFDLGEDREPQVWELGVKEVWKVPKPLDRVIHTIGPWPLKLSAEVRADRRHLDLPDEGREDRRRPRLDRLRHRPRVRRRDDLGPRPAAAVQAAPARAGRSSRAASASAGAPRRCRAAATGRCPSSRCRARVLVGDAGGMVDTVALKGVHHCDQVRHARRRGDLRRAEGAAAPTSRPTRRRSRSRSIGKELYEVRNTRQPFQKGFLQGGPLVNLMIATKGRFPGGRWPWHRNDAQPMFVGKTHEQLSEARRQVHVRQALVASSSPATRRATTRRTTSACRRTSRARSPRRGAGCARPASTRSPRTRPRTGNVDVIVNYTNCVQCGAITAKGGRLTTPEGGDGPLYQIT